jgi:hypothetical protein
MKSWKQQEGTQPFKTVFAYKVESIVKNQVTLDKPDPAPMNVWLILACLSPIKTQFPNSLNDPANVFFAQPTMDSATIPKI